MQHFRKTLPSLREKFLKKYRYPVTLFYSPNVGFSDDVREIKRILEGFQVAQLSV